MHVLHVWREGGDGGAQRAIREIARATQDAGYSATVAAAPGDFDFGVRKVEIPPWRRSPRDIPRMASSLKRVVADVGPDVIHCHSVGLGLVLEATAWRKPPLIIALPGLPADSYTSRLGWSLRLGRATIVAYGPATSGLLDRIGVPHRTLHYGIGPPPAAVSRSALAAAVDVDPADRIVVCVGRLVAQKNQQVIVRALKDLPADVVCVLVGEGADRRSLLDLAKEFGVSDRLRITGWRNDARAFLGAADVVVLPSLWEGFPLAALEALQAGAAFVVSDAPGLREWIDNEETALVVAVDDSRATATAISRLLEEPSLALRLGNSAAEFGKEFTLARMVAEHFALYADVLGYPICEVG